MLGANLADSFFGEKSLRLSIPRFVPNRLECSQLIRREDRLDRLPLIRKHRAAWEDERLKPLPIVRVQLNLRAWRKNRLRPERAPVFIAHIGRSP